MAAVSINEEFVASVTTSNGACDVDRPNLQMRIAEPLEQLSHAVKLEGLVVVVDDADSFVIGAFQEMPDEGGIGAWKDRFAFGGAATSDLLLRLDSLGTNPGLLFSGGSHDLAMISKCGPWSK